MLAYSSARDEARSQSPTAKRRRSSLVLAACVAALVAPAPGLGQDTYGPPVPAELQIASAPKIPAPPAIPSRLAAAAESAVETYPAIQAGEATIRAAGADIRSAKWLRFPSLTVAGRMDNDRTGALGTEIQVDQPIWSGGRITANIERAEAGRDVAEARLDETAEDIALRVVAAYYEVVRTTKRAELLRKSLAEHERLVESMKRRVEQEVSPASDLDLATSRAAQVRQDLTLTTAQWSMNLQRLAELVGVPPQQYQSAPNPSERLYELLVGPLPDYSPQLHHPPTEGAVPQALACDPTRRRLTGEAAIANADRKISEASILPRLSAQYSRNEVVGDRVGLVLQAQTNGGLSSFSAAESARLRQQASELQISVAERELREQIILELVENTTARNRIESSSAAAASADNVRESFMRQFVTGRRSWLDVMNAVRESMTAEVTLAEAQTGAMASAARLLLLTCEWRPDLMGPAS